MTDRTGAVTLDPHDPAIVVEALLDGERVAAGDLRAALEDPAAREHFVDLLVLRAAVGVAEAAVPSTWTAAPRHRKVRWLALAAALVISLSAGYGAGRQAAPVPAVAATVEAVVQASDTPVAPAPTRVITLTPGVNWVDRQEGR